MTEEIKKPDSNEKSLPPNIKPAMYIMFDEVKQSFFVIGAPGFLDDAVRAYGALKIAEKNLDDFYCQKQSFKENFLSGVRAFNTKMNFRRFWNGRK